MRKKKEENDSDVIRENSSMMDLVGRIAFSIEHGDIAGAKARRQIVGAYNKISEFIQSHHRSPSFYRWISNIYSSWENLDECESFLNGGSI